MISVQHDGVGVQIHSRVRAAMDFGPTSSVVVTVDEGVPVQVNGRHVTRGRDNEQGDPVEYWDLSYFDGEARLWRFDDGTVGVDVKADLNRDEARQLAGKILLAAGAPAASVETFLGSILG